MHGSVFFKMSGRIAMVGGLLVTLASSGDALADTAKGFDVQSFRPDYAPRGLVIAPISEALSHLSVSAGFFFSFSLNPLGLFDQNGQKVLDIVKNRVELDVMAAIGITKWFELGVILPGILYQGGDDLNSTDLGRNGTVNSSALGDISVIAKVPFIHRKTPDIGFGMAASLRTNFPTGSVNDFTSDGAFTFNPTLIADYRFKTRGILLSASAGVYFRPTVVLSQADGARLGPMFTGQAGVEIPLFRERGISAIGGFYANVPLTTPIIKGCIPAEALLGLRWYNSTTWITFTTGLNFGADCGLGVPQLRYWLSAIFGSGPEHKRIEFFKKPNCPTKRLGPNDDYFSQCPLVQRKGNRIISLKGIQFIKDETQVDPASFILLDQIVAEAKKALAENPNSYVLIEGHTDPDGPPGNVYNYNIFLSRRRAERIMAYLVQHDVPPQRLATIGYAFLQPVPDDELPDPSLSAKCQQLPSSDPKAEQTRSEACDKLYYIYRRIDLSIKQTKQELDDALAQAPKLITSKPAAAPVEPPPKEEPRPARVRPGHEPTGK